MKTKTYLLSVIGFSMLFFSCSNSTNNRKVLADYQKSVAYFDYFSYKGQDDFYAENPLNSEDEFYNPILPGWYSDPSICTNGEDYFLVTSTFVNFPGVPIFHSKDLVNWKQVGNVLNRESQLVNMVGQYTSGGIFAPAISYNPYNQTYYMITTNVGAGNFFVKTKDPFGSWSDPIWLPEVQGIDPSFFFDDDGKAYIVNNDAPDGKPEYDGHRAIRIQQFDIETEKTFGSRKVLVDKGIHPEDKPIWIEGPHMYKINNQYFLMAAEGGTGTKHSEVILRSSSPMGPFIAWGKNPILTQRHLDPNRPNPITCAGHADLIQAQEGDWWAVFLACRPIDGKFENLGRETFMLPVRWSDDGFPYIIQGDEVVSMIGRRKGVKRSNEVTFGNFSKFDDFDSTKLGLEWMTMRTSASDLYSLTTEPGYLTFKCGPSAKTEDALSFVCRRVQHHKFECTTQMYFDPSDNSEAAGLLLYKDETHQYFMAVQKTETGRKILLKKIGSGETEVLAAKMIENVTDPISLKVESNGTNCSFYYLFGGSDWALLCSNIDAYYLSTANSFGFTGTTIGMYAEKKEMIN